MRVMPRNRYRTPRPEIFNALRIEAWQRRLTRGDCFLVFLRPGVAVWGVVEAQASDDTWHSTLYSAASPEGIHDLVKVTQMDLPVTGLQFATARRMEWPCEMNGVRAIISMAPCGVA